MNIFSKLSLLTLVLLCCNKSDGADINWPQGPHQIQVGVDKAGDPITYGVNIQGINDGRPVIIFTDSYFGINGWQCYQDLFGLEYYTVAVDPLAMGTSSKNTPTAMDGVLGFPVGYSYEQQAHLMNQLFKNLDLKGPINWFSIDTLCSVGIYYAYDFADSDLAISKLCMIESSPQGVVSNDPCSLAFLTPEGATGLIAAYIADPCATLCALLGDSFLTTDCPEYAQTQLNASIQFAATQPGAVFERYFSQVYTEDLTPLMSSITIPVINFYGTTSNIDPISLPSCIVTVCQYSPTCNPTLGIPCPPECPLNLILPFPNSRFITIPGHGTGLHVSAFDEVALYIAAFISGQDQACTPCPKTFNMPNNCPDCPS